MTHGSDTAQAIAPAVVSGAFAAESPIWTWVCTQGWGQRALVVGARQALAAVLLAREGLAVTLIDADPGLLAQARAAIDDEPPQVRARLVSLEADLPSLASEALFDYIVLVDALARQASPDRLLRQAANHLAQDGRVVVADGLATSSQAMLTAPVLPRLVTEWARQTGLQPKVMDTEAGCLRAVLTRPDPQATTDDDVDVLQLTESLAFAIRQDGIAQLGQRDALVRKLSGELQTCESKLADAAAQLDAMARTQTSRTEALDAIQRQAIATLKITHQRDLERLNRALADSNEARRQADLALAKWREEATRARAGLRRDLAGERLASPADGALPSGADPARPSDRAPLAAPRPEPSAPPAIPVHLLPEGSVDGLIEHLNTHGWTGFAEHVHQVATRMHPHTLALRVLQAGRALAERGSPQHELDLARLAYGLDPSDRTLSGACTALQRTVRVEDADRFIREIEAACRAKPTATQKAILAKLHKLPAMQLRVLSLLPSRKPPAARSVARRVCYFVHSSLPYSSGEYSTRSHGVAAGLMTNGYDVVVVTRPGFPLDVRPELAVSKVKPENLIDGVRYVRQLKPRRHGMSLRMFVNQAADAAERLLRAERPSLVVAASNHMVALPAMIAARRLGLPFVYEVRGLWEVTRQSREPAFADTQIFAVQKLLESRVAQLADLVFALTGPMCKELVQRGVASDQVRLLPNGCDTERFKPRERDEAMARQLGIPVGIPVIGHVGTFIDREGMDDLAAACALLKQRGVEFRLMLVGSDNDAGPGRVTISQRIKEVGMNHGFSAWLIMPGRVSNTASQQYESLIDIAVFPHRASPVCDLVAPAKPLEALAMQKAVVVSSVAALVELVADGQTGRVFEKGNVESLAQGLLELIADRPRLQELGRKGRAWVCETRSWRQIGTIFAEHVQVYLAT